jgi:hypothetical protein
MYKNKTSSKPNDASKIDRHIMTLSNHIVIFSFLTGLVALLFSHRKHKATIEVFIYWACGIIMILFAALRPLGSAIDDKFYYKIIGQSCSDPRCILDSLLQRDGLWHFTIKIFQLLGFNIYSPQLLSSIDLTIKLAIIYRLTHKRILALYAYLTIYYIMYDITALKASFSMMFYMLTLALLAQKKYYLSLAPMLLSGLAHFQGFIVPVILAIGKTYKNKLYFFLIGLAPIILLFSGFYPTDDLLKEALTVPALSHLINPKGIDIELAAKALDKHVHGSSRIAISTLLLYLLALVLSCLDFDKKNTLIKYSSLSVLLAGCLIYMYAFSPPAQFRFASYLLLPSIFLIGAKKTNKLGIYLTIIIGALHTAKYNIIHQSLYDPSRISISTDVGGKVSSEYYMKCDNLSCTTEMNQAVLTARPEPGFQFAGWEGACRGVSVTCKLSTESSAVVHARFQEAFKLTVNKLDSGLIQSEDKNIDCGTRCTYWYPQQTKVILTATAVPGRYFKTWEGNCNTTNPRCEIKMESNVSLTAIFVPKYQISIVIQGDGDILQDGQQVLCNKICYPKVLGRTRTVITQRPRIGYRFDRWEDACTGSAEECVLENLESHVRLKAIFVPIMPQDAE